MAITVIFQYAGYVGRVRHDFEMYGREFKHCQTFCPAVVNVEEMSGTEKSINYPAESFLFAGDQVAKCLAGNQNAGQITECLPDILSGTPEIILAIAAIKIKITLLYFNVKVTAIFKSCLD